jgi:hypothetical protein
MKIARFAVISIFGLSTFTPAFAGPVGVERGPSANQQPTLQALQTARETNNRQAQTPTVKGSLAVRYMDGGN